MAEQTRSQLLPVA